MEYGQIEYDKCKVIHFGESKKNSAYTGNDTTLKNIDEQNPWAADILGFVYCGVE